MTIPPKTFIGKAVRLDCHGETKQCDPLFSFDAPGEYRIELASEVVWCTEPCTASGNVTELRAVPLRILLE